MTEPKKQQKLPRKEYQRELERLQAELVKLQYWVVEQGLKIIVVFEGRDAAGKGGVIKRITERVSPRVFRVVALPKPTDEERTQMYLQRYMRHFPSAGEVVIFDRSWYNRAGVERVMGYCTDEEYRRFMRQAPYFEQAVVDADIVLIKYWLDISIDVQEARFHERIDDPRKIWKLSPIDVTSFDRWYDYSRARDAMLDATDTPHAPWTVVPANDSRRARLNCIAHLLDQVPYKDVTPPPIALGERELTGAYDDRLDPAARHFVPQRY
jgi:polyphosphate kinase 2